MSYEVTATRRRPQRFEDLVGQEFVAATLKNSLHADKIAHAYLFAGPRGCGKTSTARILAKALNCKNGPTDEPCGTCTSCQEITKGASMDVIEIDGASNTSVNDVRQIKDEVLFPPQSGKYKIYIIDEVHMLSNSAFNALLKTIEEPPPYVVFIFATTELQKVPATIKSRCQQFNFRLVSIDQVKNLLADAAKEINIQADDEALFWIARESTGSIRDAYTLFDQVAAFSGDHITYDKIRNKLGLVGIDRLNELFLLCVQGQAQQALNKLDEYLQLGISIEQLISNTTDYLRSLLLIKNGIVKESLLGQSADRYNKTVVDAWTSIQIERGLSLFLQLYRDIRYSVSPRYELELAFSRLCWLSQYVSPAEVKHAIDAAHALLGGQTPQTQPVPQAIAQQPVQTVQTTQQAQSQPLQQGQQGQQPAQTNQMPAGMPMFSALKNAIQQQPVQQTPQAPAAPVMMTPPSAGVPPITDSDDDIPDAEADEGQPEEEESDGSDYASYAPDTSPFPDGGAEPPEQTAEIPQSDDLKALRGKVIASLSVNDPLTASSLMQTGEWTQNGNTIQATVPTEFLQQQLTKQLDVITKYVQNMANAPYTIVITVEHAVQTQSEPVELPPQVQMLCQAFRGTVVTNKK